MDHHCHQWSLTVESKAKLHYYQKIKIKFSVENYCNVKLNRSQRSLLAKFRLGMFPINVELGRYKRIPREERICPICNLNEVEDEIHILFRCGAYDEARKTLLDSAATYVLLEDVCDTDIIKILTTHEFLKNCMLLESGFTKKAKQVNNLLRNF